MNTERPTFDHADAGTAEDVWTTELTSRDLPSVGRLLHDRDRLIVLAAHPDDETLGAGGLIASTHRAGWEIQVVCATAGEASHPQSTTHTPEQLADLRDAELRTAVRALAPDADVQLWGLPDGDLEAHERRLVTRLVNLVGQDGERTVIAAPWRHDAHGDHESAGRAAALAAQRTDAVCLEYPIWLWHWGTPDDVPWDRLRTLHLEPDALDLKRLALAAHVSQTSPLSDQPGDEQLLSDRVQSHFERTVEAYVVEDSTHDDDLERLHRDDENPWQVDGWYERRKRALSLAALPRERYASALEVGSSIGALAEDLAPRVDHLLAIDSSPTAAAAARQRLSPHPHAEVQEMQVPEHWPDTEPDLPPPDLVVVSEVGYFLSPAQLDGLVQRVADTLAPGGHVLLVHWRHHIDGWPLDADDVHRRFLAHPRWHRVSALREDDFLLDVLEAQA